MTDWFYEREGSPQGPITEGEIASLAKAGQLGRDTKVWTSDFGSQWRPAHQTQLSPFLIEQPPALTAEQPPSLSHVSNKWLWCLVATPVVITILLNLKGPPPGGDISFGEAEATWLFSLLFAFADLSRIKKVGLESRVGKIGVWALFVMPVFVFKRNKRLLQSQLTFWMLLLSYFLSVAIDIALEPFA